MQEFIKQLLFSKSKNHRFVIRYIKFIEYCENRSFTEGEYHHILPKSSDMFPEYENFNDYSWNSIKLGYREHYLAHYFLAKSFGGKQIFAFWAMCNGQERLNRRNYIVNAKLYEAGKSMAQKQYKISNSRPNPGVAKAKKGKVSCYDDKGNFKIVSKEEFDSSPNLKGVNSGRSLPHDQEYAKGVSLRMKNRTHFYHPITQQRIFVKLTEEKSEDFYLSQGYTKTIKGYDRKNTIKECPHCQKNIDASNFKRWHGDKCKLSPLNS